MHPVGISKFGLCVLTLHSVVHSTVFRLGKVSGQAIVNWYIFPPAAIEQKGHLERLPMGCTLVNPDFTRRHLGFRGHLPISLGI